MHDCDRQPTPGDGVGSTDVRFELHGVVGIESAHDIHAAACRAESGTGDVHVKCANAEQLDGAVIQILLALDRDLRGRGRRLYLEGLSASASEDLRLAGAGRWLGESA